MADSIAESARKASAGSWRKPRMKIYDYNQVSQIFACIYDEQQVNKYKNFYGKNVIHNVTLNSCL